MTSSPIYLIECAFFGINGVACSHAFIERNSNDTDYTTTVRDIAEGQVENVVRVIELTIGEPSRDVTEDIARDIFNRLWADCERCPACLRDFLDNELGASEADKLDYRAGVLEPA